MIKHHIILPFLFISYDNIVSNRNTISYQMIHCPIIWYNILSYVILLYYIIIQYCKVLFDMKLYTLHDTILYPKIWYDIVSYHTIRYFNIEHLVWFSYVIGKWLSLSRWDKLCLLFLTYKHFELQLSGPELIGPMSKYDKKQYKVIP